MDTRLYPGRVMEAGNDILGNMYYATSNTLQLKLCVGGSYSWLRRFTSDV
jgi:hypothetical protein